MNCAVIGDTIEAVISSCGIPELKLTDWGLELVEKLVYGSEETITVLFFLNGILERIGG